MTATLDLPSGVKMMTEPVGTETQPEKQEVGLRKRIRSVARYRYAAMAVGAVVGLAAASQHWLGLIAGGALVALPAQTMVRGAVAGVAFGLVAVVSFVVVLWLGEFTTAAVAMGVPFWAAVGIGVGAGAVGALARGII